MRSRLRINERESVNWVKHIAVEQKIDTFFVFVLDEQKSGFKINRIKCNVMTHQIELKWQRVWVFFLKLMLIIRNHFVVSKCWWIYSGRNIRWIQSSIVWHFAVVKLFVQWTLWENIALRSFECAIASSSAHRRLYGMHFTHVNWQTCLWLGVCSVNKAWNTCEVKSNQTV